MAVPRTGYTADEVHGWEFTLEPTAFVLAPGERLRLEIASSAFPLYDRNPSNGTPPAACRPMELDAIDTADSAFAVRIPLLFILPVKGEPGMVSAEETRFLRLPSTA